MTDPVERNFSGEGLRFAKDGLFRPGREKMFRNSRLFPSHLGAGIGGSATCFHGLLRIGRCLLLQ
jgi:hypothetical protein